jgi:Lipocalin-like domain
MKKIAQLILMMVLVQTATAQSPVGKWKRISYTVVYDGQKMDSHAALLKQRPCADKIVYEINADGTWRLNAANSGCDEKYRKIQEKLYSQTKWKLAGNQFTVSATNFALGQTHTISFAGNKMTFVNKDETIVYQRL